MLSLKHFKYLFRGFTLVELIVVISVLGVLATIAMSQVSNITSWARDSQRMTDMSAMKSSIELYKAKTGKLPTPTSGSWVTYSGGLLWTQGTFGESVTREIKSITPKPTDPINKLEYVYSVANNNREFELGGILEKATWYLPNILPELLAASQNVTFIEWTYNWISLKVETGSKVYVVAAPSLIGGYLGATMENTGLTIEWLGSLPKGFSWTATSTANTGTFMPVVAWSGSKLPETATWAEALVAGLQSAYTGTVATSLSQISSLVNATGSQVTALGQGLIQNALGGTVTTSTSQNIETPLTPFFIGSGTTAIPWKKYDGTSPKTCQEYNLNATHSTTGVLRGAWTCGDGTKTCLSDGFYSLDLDWTGALASFSAYCDMNTSSGWWTRIVKDSTTTLADLAKFWDTSAISSTFYSDASYGIGWGTNDQYFKTYIMVDIPFSSMKVTYTGRYDGGNHMGIMCFHTTTSLNGYYWDQVWPSNSIGLRLEDWHAWDSNGQYLQVNETSIFAGSQTNVFNRSDTITSKNRFISMTGYTSIYSYNRRYIKELWIK